MTKAKGVTYRPDGTVLKCLFCDIMDKVEPGSIVRENELFVAFKTIAPASSNHLLICPRMHIQNVNTLTGSSDVQMLNKMKEFGRLALGDDSADAQYSFHIPPWNSIDHLHMHAIGNRPSMGWKGALKYWQGTFYCWSVEEAIRVIEKASQG